jgi:hypothetical protein
MFDALQAGKARKVDYIIVDRPDGFIPRST